MCLVIDNLSRSHLLDKRGIPDQHLKVVIKPHEELDNYRIVVNQGSVEMLQPVDPEQHDTRIVAVFDVLTEDLCSCKRGK